MTFTMFVGWALAGLLAGVLAGLVVSRGGHGLKGDIYLGLAGAIAGSWALRAIGLAPGNSVVAGAIVAFVFAGVLIAVQRRFRPVEPAREEHVMLWRGGPRAGGGGAWGWGSFRPRDKAAAARAGVP